jgi:hypothetical protein
VDIRFDGEKHSSVPDLEDLVYGNVGKNAVLDELVEEVSVGIGEKKYVGRDLNMVMLRSRGLVGDHV